MRARSRQPLRSHAVLTLLGSLLILTVSAASDALAAGSWSTTGSMTVARIQHAATRLVDGRVLVTGSFNPDGSDLASAELYDPTATARRIFSGGIAQRSSTCG